MDFSDPADKKRYHRDWKRQQATERLASGLCVKCGEGLVRLGGRICQPCLDKLRAKRKGLSARGKCHQCGKATEPPYTRCGPCRQRNMDRYYASGWRVRQLAAAKVARQVLKREVLEAYGGAVCQCCGETHIEFLSLDHIDGNGKAHRKTFGIAATSGGWNFYAQLKKHNYPSGMRCLCMNCNFALGHVGYCPHQVSA